APALLRLAVEGGVANGERRMCRESLEQIEIARLEPRGIIAPPHHDDAQQPSETQERLRHGVANAELGGRLVAVRPGRIVVHEEAAEVRGARADQSGSEWESAERPGPARPRLAEPAAIEIGQVDRSIRADEDPRTIDDQG